MLQIHLLVLLIVGPLLTMAGISMVAAYFKVRHDSGRWKLIDQKDWSHEGLAMAGTITGVIGGLVILSLLVAAIPYQPKYWVLTETQGELVSISNRFASGTGDVSGVTYTITLVGDPTPRVVTDSRILGLSVGDEVSLTCSLEWVYGGADKSNCFLRDF